jgi:hypothetical protein
MSDIEKDQDKTIKEFHKKFIKIRSWCITIIFLLIIIILIGIFCSNCYIVYINFIISSIFGNCNRCQIFIGIITGIILIPVAFSIQTNMRCNQFSDSMIKEIISNKSQMDEFFNNLDIVKKYWDANEEKWLPKGVSLGTPWLSAYLPNIAFRAFIDQGFHIRIESGKFKRLANFYWSCEVFSTTAHDIESRYLRVVGEERITKEEAYSLLKKGYESSKDFFYDEFDAINPNDQKALGKLSLLQILFEATYIPWLYNEIKNFFE